MSTRRLLGQIAEFLGSARISQLGTTIVHRYRAVLVGLVLFGVVVGYAFGSFGTAQYEASAEVVVATNDPVGQILRNQVGTADPAREVSTQAALVGASQVLDAAARSVGLGPDGRETLNTRIRVVSDVNSNVLTIFARWEDPAKASSIATAMATAYVNFRKDFDARPLETALKKVEDSLAELKKRGETSGPLYAEYTRTKVSLTTGITQVSGGVGATLLQPARKSTQVAPKPVTTALFTGFVFLLLGLALVWLIQRIQEPRIVTSDDAADAMDAPVLATIDEAAERRAVPGKGPLLAQLPDVADGEGYRTLAAALDVTEFGASRNVVLIAGAEDGEDRSTIAANLAVAAMYTGKSVALCDLDLRQPLQHRIFRLGRGEGVIDVLTGDVALDEVENTPPMPAFSDGARGPRAGKLVVVPAGLSPPNPADFAASAAMGEVLSSLRKRFDLVVVDSSAWLQSGDALAIARHVDGIIAVARARSTSRRALADLRTGILRSGSPLIGIVVTGIPSRRSGGLGLPERDRPSSVKRPVSKPRLRRPPVRESDGERVP